MNKNSALVPAFLGLAAALASAPAEAADHLDSPGAQVDTTADITDVFGWMNADTSKLNLIMNVAPMASGAAFGTAVQYVFHVNSGTGLAALGAAQTETLIICQFYASDGIECWANGDYLVGDPSNTAGVVSTGGGMRVFAGLRNDPFFMEFAGFGETVSAVLAAAPGLTPDANGCYPLDMGTSNTLVGLLQGSANGSGMAVDTFAGTNVLSLVIELDKTMVNGGGDILGVWASTHAAN